MKKLLPYIFLLLILVGFFIPMAQVHAQAAAPAVAGVPSTLEQNLKSCGVIVSGSFDGCIEKLFYFLFFSIPAWLLALSAKLFNALIAIALSSTLFASSTFIATAWAVVRDLSNIFFILIYNGFQSLSCLMQSRG